MSPIEIELQRQLKQFWLKDIESTFDVAFTAMQAGFADAGAAIKGQYAANDALKSDGYNKKTLAIGVGGAVLALVAGVLAIPSGGTSIGAFFGVSTATVTSIASGTAATGAAVSLVATTMPAMAPAARASHEVETMLSLLDSQLKQLKAKLFVGNGSSELIEKVFKAARVDPKFEMATKRSDTEKLRRSAIVALFFPRFKDAGDFSSAVRSFSSQSFTALLREFNAHLEVQTELAAREVQKLGSDYPVRADPRYPAIMVRDPAKEAAIRNRFLLPTAVAQGFLRSAQLGRWLRTYQITQAAGWGLGRQ